MAQTLTRTFPDGDYPTRLMAAADAYERAIAAEKKPQPPLLNGERLASEILADEYADLKAESEADAAEKQRIVTLRALGRKQWRTLKENHPPRVGEGHDEDTIKSDRLAGVNIETVGDDLVYGSVIAPAFTSRAAFDEWADELSEGEWNTLTTDAWRLVNVAQFDPKSLPQSRTQPEGAS